jgi:signal transduction histidine kinase
MRASLIVVVLASVAALALLALGTDRVLEDDLFGGVGGVGFLILAVAFAVVGAVVPRRIGRVFMAIGLLTSISTLCYAYARRDGPGAEIAAWLWNPLSQPEAPLLGLALLLFPDGRLPSPRWRPVAAVLALSALLVGLGPLVRPSPLTAPFTWLPSLTGIEGAGTVAAALDLAGFTLAIAGVALAAAAARRRLRQAAGVERLQLKLVLSVGTVVAAITVAMMLTWFFWPHDAMQQRMGVIGLAFSAFPVAAGIAIRRYRLYDVDFVLDRTLTYTALTLALAAVYGATTLVLGIALGRGSTWATAGATLVVAVAFGPLRRVLQDAVDRRFRRARYEARRTITAFLEELRAGRAEPEEIEPLLRAALGDPTLELRYVLPDGCVRADGTAVAEHWGDPRVRTPIERGGVPLAFVLHRPTGPQRPDPLAELVSAGGLAIEIVRLRTAPGRGLAVVAASRARKVAARDAERRRIERDLHDGAQQRLISIGLELRHIQHESGIAALDHPVAELSGAIDELRELAHGLPPSQLDAGLEPALRELAGRAPLPVAVRATYERFSVGVEAAAYFVSCEGLTNAIKHAGASSVTLSVQRQNGRLIVRRRRRRGRSARGRLRPQRPARPRRRPRWAAAGA